MFRRRASGAALRRVGLSCAVALTGLTAVAPTVAEAQGPGTGKRVMLYTGTTQLREASIAVATPVIQGKLEELGYTVDWEDCNRRGGRPDELQPPGQEPADLHDRQPGPL